MNLNQGWPDSSKKEGKALSQFLYMMATGQYVVEDPELKKHLKPKKARPWKEEHLTKEERKGKTWEELEELRKKQWVKRVLNRERKIKENGGNSENG